MVFKVALATVYKMITFKKGSLSMLSLVLSGSFTLYAKKILEGTDLKHLIIPVLIFAVGFILYFSFLVADLFTGLQVAKYQSLKENGGKKVPYVKSYKLYRTLWKLLGIIMLSVLMMISALMVEIIDLNFLYKVFIMFQGTVWLLSCGFELHSIGENHLKRFGYKPKIFQFFDKIVNIFEAKVIDKFNKTFDILETEPEEIVEQVKEKKDDTSE